jgi:hypothetical protein
MGIDAETRVPAKRVISGSDLAAQTAEVAPRWSFASRVAFRFSSIYLGVFMLLEVLDFVEWVLFNPVPNSRIYVDDLPPFHNITVWTAKHIFHIANPSGPITEYNGLIWFEVFWILIVAILATIIWSVLDRKRNNYAKLHVWFRLVVVLLLATAMFAYGTLKVIPVQMWFPRLTSLLERFGDFSPMALLWNSIGASPGYEFFTGCAEIAGGILLVIPRTTMLGALICAPDMANVFTLNMTYDVNVKSISSRLLLMAVFLLAPDARRLMNFFLLNRAVGPSSLAPLFRNWRTNRIALAAQVVAGLVLLAGGLRSAVQRYETETEGVPKPPLYGIWTVEDFSLDGQSRPPLVTDDARWRRVVFQNLFPWTRRDEIFQRGKFATAEEMDTYGMDDEPRDGWITLVDTNARTLQTYSDSKNFESWSYTQPAPNQLILDGFVKGHKIQARLQLFDASKLYLLAHRSEFHWVGSGAYR